MSQAVGNTALAYARVWHHSDAKDRVLGKLAERIAIVLMGKHKPIYDPREIVDCGDYVVVTNANQHSLYPGGLKEIKYKDMMSKKPDEIIRKAVSGMLPKNKLRERRLERLRIFEGPDMGIFQKNILKRWEDGTLKSAPPS
ncbi:60S ribosomal protein L23 [Multifurca ochricompacta]|uniref:60S ribosomal protein L23 n=1 Tax=Multifurca ochricompacta TaxID=376703 RepID=A0AAD4QUJ8_9AGAM|nr:60S ribosomal protein L23 [Multifurca ochricompacta]